MMPDLENITDEVVLRNAVLYPSFIIGGAAKSGTTSLGRYLCAQPGIFVPDSEPNFFTYTHKTPVYTVHNHPFVQNIAHYLNLMNPPDEKGHTVITGEKSVSYLYKEYYQQVIENIKNHHPDWKNMKWVFILRNPVERAFSQYIHNRNFHEKLPFFEAIQKWPERKKAGWIPAYDYLGAGLYSKPLASYYNQFKFVRAYVFEDLTDRPGWLVNDIFKFLGIEEPVQPVSFEKHNPSALPSNKILERVYRLIRDKASLKQFMDKGIPPKLRKWIKSVTLHKPAMSGQEKHSLIKYYKPEIKELETLINHNLSGWYHD